jgi:hypothetical protein
LHRCAAVCAITDELFADPRSGLLEPVQAVQGWLQLLSGHD